MSSPAKAGDPVTRSLRTAWLFATVWAGGYWMPYVHKRSATPS
jgi:hypothetical protein